MDPSHDLVSLLNAIGRRDRRAFDELYGRSVAKLFGVVLRIVGTRDKAEDVLQDVYLRIWQNAGSYAAESGRPMTWLIAIARNRAIDAVREGGRRPVTAGPDADEMMNRVPDPADGTVAFEARDGLALCLSRLDPEHRRCLLEAYHHGYSREELSERFGRPVNTIKTWLHRTTAALRACLAEA